MHTHMIIRRHWILWHQSCSRNCTSFSSLRIRRKNRSIRWKSPWTISATQRIPMKTRRCWIKSHRKCLTIWLLLQQLSDRRTGITTSQRWTESPIPMWHAGTRHILQPWTWRSVSVSMRACSSVSRRKSFMICRVQRHPSQKSIPVWLHWRKPSPA